MKQGDLVDNTANFHQHCVFLFFTQWTRIAV